MDRAKRDRAEAGFTLIELAIVITILGLIIGMGADMMGGWLARDKVKQTKERLEAVEEALILFVSQHQRLPCPADGSLSTGVEDPSGGGGACGSGTNANQARGVVPWTTLGLSADAVEDAWHRKITYRVDPALTANQGMYMVHCRACGAISTASASCPTDFAPLSCGAAIAPIRHLIGKGLRVNDETGVTLMDPASTSQPNGAAFVLISHGANGRGAIVGTNAPDTPPNADEAANANGIAVSNYTATGGTAAYVDGLQRYQEDNDANIFDDLLRRPTIMWVVNRAGLGPMAQE